MYCQSPDAERIKLYVWTKLEIIFKPNNKASANSFCMKMIL